MAIMEDFKTFFYAENDCCIPQEFFLTLTSSRATVRGRNVADIDGNILMSLSCALDCYLVKGKDALAQMIKREVASFT